MTVSEGSSFERPRTLPERMTCDVAIVGYGPIGITLAALLAQAGHRVIVVERFPQRYDKPRAAHFDGETMRTFQYLGIAREVELIVRKMNTYEAVSANHETLTSLKAGEAGSGWHKSYTFHQPELEECIHARGLTLGVQVVMNATAIDICQTSDGVQLFVCDSDDANGAPCAIDAAYIVGADGSNSFVRQQLGIERRDLGFAPLQDLAVDFVYNDPDIEVPLLAKTGHLLDDNHIITFGRWGGGRTSRVEVCKVEGGTYDYLADEKTAWKFLTKFGLTPEIGRIARNAIYTFECTVSTRWRQGRVFLAGDAAHTSVPFMGQGVCAGIRDAANLSWKLDAVLSGQADDSFLDTYESERTPHALGVIRMAMALGAMVMPAAAGDSETLRAELKANGEQNSSQVFPRLGDGIVRDTGDPAAIPTEGRPSLQARVGRHGRVDLLDEFLDPGWKLITRHPVPAGLLNETQTALISDLSMQIAHVSRAAGDRHFIDIDGDYDSWFQATGRRAFVVRPDNYVFGAAETIEDIPELLDTLAETLRSHGWARGANKRPAPEETKP